MTSLVVPKLNINGTSYAQLRQDYMLVHQLSQKLMEALAMCAPHGRDFQTVRDPEVSLSLCREQHRARQEGVRKVFTEVEAIIVSLDNQSRSVRTKGDGA